MHHAGRALCLWEFRHGRPHPMVRERCDDRWCYVQYHMNRARTRIIAQGMNEASTVYSVIPGEG